MSDKKIVTVRDLMAVLQECNPDHEVVLFVANQKHDVWVEVFDENDPVDNNIDCVYGFGDTGEPLIAIGAPSFDHESDEHDEEAEAEDDAAWREEQAMELGMGLGIDAYNDARGCSTGEPEWSPDED